MIPIEEARARMVALARPLEGVEGVALGEAHGRRLAGPVAALRTQPGRDLSAMDGYALRARDAGGALALVGESAAGRAFGRAIGAGETVRIFTGAALPEGADCVLIQENAAVADGVVRQVAGVAPVAGRHVRRAGFDFRAGAVLAEAGTLVTARTIALAATAGHATLDVRRRVRVAILSTGDELVAPGTETGADGLPSSNAAMLAAMLAGPGIALVDHGIVRDEAGAIREAIGRAAEDADLLVTTGGASVGDHDLVRPALAAAGAAIDFWRVAMRPGKPLIAGTLGDMLVLGLPGNPVSAYVTALMFVRPAVRMLGGAAAGDAFPEAVPMRLAAGLKANDERTDFLRARAGADGLVPAGPNDSAALLGLAAADALIVRAPHAPAVPAGAMADAIPLS